MAYAIFQNERLYAIPEVTQGTVPTIAATNAMRFTTATLNSDAAILTPNNKTGTRSQSRFAKGRRKGSNWQVVMDLAGSGTAGTKPDSDPFFQAAFGQVGTVVAATSVTYSMADTLIPLSIFAYKNNPTTLNNHISLGSLERELKIGFGQDFAVLTASGDSMWSLDSTSFASATATEKGGLAAFPAEPASQTYNGTEIVGFTGSITIAGSAIAEIREGTVTITTGNSPIADTFGSFYPNGMYGARRNVTLDINAYDSDSAGMNALRLNALTQTAVSATIVFGTVAGNILTCTIGRLILPLPQQAQNSDRFTNAFQGCRCLASTDTAKDELSMAWT
ncbi:MAG: hypothetical protein NVS9B4_01020 [Candidatus Acidiferrum sp.]